VTLSPDQAAALTQLEDFLRAPRRTLRQPYFVLHGLAGTGKTTLMAHLTRSYRGITLAAFTGKAASVLRTKTGLPASTLHSVVYDFRGMAEDEETGEEQPVFVSKGAELPDHVVLIDESSMVGHTLAEEVLATGARVVACGDPGQLPPVRDAQFFTEANATLVNIHRQALGSPIIRQAHAVRTAGDYAEDGPEFRVVPRGTPEEILGHDVILCWRNRTRRDLNARKRELLGHPRDQLLSGEPVMCLRNNHRLGIYNGATYDLAAPWDPATKRLALAVAPSRVLWVENATVEDHDPDYEERRREDTSAPFALAYAATVHKSQGSEWPSVLLFDEATRDRVPWLYTGITRAAERVTVVRWRD
jgi:exodeoxyribonuclease-5